MYQFFLLTILSQFFQIHFVCFLFSSAIVKHECSENDGIKENSSDKIMIPVMYKLGKNSTFIFDEIYSIKKKSLNR